jgi:hypothetical protein
MAMCGELPDEGHLQDAGPGVWMQNLPEVEKLAA